jgi:hypothetical protein
MSSFTKNVSQHQYSWGGIIFEVFYKQMIFGFIVHLSAKQHFHGG